MKGPALELVVDCDEVDEVLLELEEVVECDPEPRKTAAPAAPIIRTTTTIIRRVDVRFVLLSAPLAQLNFASRFAGPVS